MLKIFVSAQIRCPLGCLSGPGWVGGDTFYKINYYFGQRERILSHVPHGGGVIQSSCGDRHVLSVLCPTQFTKLHNVKIRII